MSSPVDKIPKNSSGKMRAIPGWSEVFCKRLNAFNPLELKGTIGPIQGLDFDNRLIVIERNEPRRYERILEPASIPSKIDHTTKRNSFPENLFMENQKQATNQEKRDNRKSFNRS